MPAHAYDITAIDAHVAGGVLRLLTSGCPSPRGRTMSDKARWFNRQHGPLLDALTREPWGYDGLLIGILAESSADADAALLVRSSGGFTPLDGRALIAAATLAVERHLIVPRTPGVIRFETRAGVFDLSMDVDTASGLLQVRAVHYTGPPAFVLAGGVPIAIGQRSVRVDLAWCGQFHAFLDSESVGLPLVASHEADLRRAARDAAAAVASAITLAHPESTVAEPLGAVVFTGPGGSERAQLRMMRVSPDGVPSRGPTTEGVMALLAVLDAMGLASHDPVAVDSIEGPSLAGRIVAHGTAGDIPAVRVAISTRAWTVAEHRLMIAADDPLAGDVFTEE